MVIGQVMPEAAADGPLGVVRDGDSIRIDLGEGRLDLVVPESEIERRLRDEPYVLAPNPKGWLGIYRAMVGPMERGAVVGDVDQS
jgi:dihydroxy-acid dehydratase